MSGGRSSDRAGRGRGEALGVGGDVLNGVGCDLGRVEHDVAHERAVEKVSQAEVQVGFGPVMVAPRSW